MRGCGIDMYKQDPSEFKQMTATNTIWQQQTPDDSIQWQMALPGVGTGHAFKLKTAQTGHYFVSSSGHLFREESGSYKFQEHFTGDVMFYDENTSIFTAQFKNGIAGMIYFR